MPKMVEECPICGGAGHINVSVYIKADGNIIPTVTAPCPRCISEKYEG